MYSVRFTSNNERIIAFRGYHQFYIKSHIFLLVFFFFFIHSCVERELVCERSFCRLHGHIAGCLFFLSAFFFICKYIIIYKSIYLFNHPSNQPSIQPSIHSVIHPSIHPYTNQIAIPLAMGIAFIYDGNDNKTVWLFVDVNKILLV